MSMAVLLSVKVQWVALWESNLQDIIINTQSAIPAWNIYWFNCITKFFLLLGEWDWTQIVSRTLPSPDMCCSRRSPPPASKLWQTFVFMLYYCCWRMVILGEHIKGDPTWLQKSLSYFVKQLAVEYSAKTAELQLCQGNVERKPWSGIFIFYSIGHSFVFDLHFSNSLPAQIPGRGRRGPMPWWRCSRESSWWAPPGFHIQDPSGRGQADKIPGSKVIATISATKSGEAPNDLCARCASILA